MAQDTLIIATRQSPLALWQAEYVKTQLLNFYPNMSIDLLPIVTKGDKILDKTLNKIGGKGLFIKELEKALLDGQADIAVHSMKDMPAECPDGLELSVIGEREDARDALVSVKHDKLIELPQGAVVGTSSLRRQCQIKALRPDLEIKSLRGNINTRLNKCMNGEYDAIILAVAGLKRLDLTQHIKEHITFEQLLPAAGQAALGIQCRTNDKKVKQLIAPLNHHITALCLAAERALTAKLGGNCQVPIAAFCEQKNDKELSLRALVGTPQGDIMLHGQQRGSVDAPEALGIAVADILLQQGADDILKSI